ncbi:hypothetical protein [Galbibacter sp. EGI 63066]|uniref:hypothetical protein n=1 Tax=Galbibacter sp. EGI 63066 TaxID=2993559 RepID=UPI002B05D5A8
MNFSKKNHEHHRTIKWLVSKQLVKTTTLVLVVTLVLFLPGRATAQGMPVYDNTNFISLAKQLIESGKQTSNLLKTVEFLKKQKKRIEQVSDVIQQLNAVQELIQNNQQLFNMVQGDLQDILNSPYIKPDEINRVIESFEDIIERSMESVEYVNKILTSDYLKMTDAERASVLKDYETQSDEMVAEVSSKTRRYKEIISFRKMQDRINNRETQY